MSVRDFIQRNYRHFNAGALSDCIESIRTFLDNDGRLMITLAGAMSTAEIGKLWHLRYDLRKYMRYAAPVRISRKTCSI